MKKRGWTIFFPRFHCPHCGKELSVSFRGRWSLPRPKRKKSSDPPEGPGTREEGDI